MEVEIRWKILLQELMVPYFSSIGMLGRELRNDHDECWFFCKFNWLMHLFFSFAIICNAQSKIYPSFRSNICKWNNHTARHVPILQDRIFEAITRWNALITVRSCTVGNMCSTTATNITIKVIRVPIIYGNMEYWKLTTADAKASLDNMLSAWLQLKPYS